MKGGDLNLNMASSSLSSNVSSSLNLNSSSSSSSSANMNISNNNNNQSSSSNMKKTGSRNRSSRKRNNNKSTSSSSNKDTKESKNSGNNKQRLQLNDDSQDIMSLIKSSKKAVDISHLVNYTYSYDDTSSQRPKSSDKSSNKKKQSKSSSSQIHLHGMSYINANYKFILNNQGDYKSQLLDPNLPLSVNSISRVVVKQNDYHCPICLGDEFVAPRMTKCGHIFCYPCIISMFDNVKNDKKKTTLGNMHNPEISCPLCSEVLKESFILLPVLIETVKENESLINSKNFYDLSLMFRNNAKIYSQPVSNFYQFKGFKGTIPWISHGCTPLDFKQFSPYVSNSRLILCDIQFLISCYEKEVDDLMTQQLIDMEVYGDAGPFYNIAIDRVQKRINELNDLYGSMEKPIRGPNKIDPSNLDSQFSNMSLNDVQLPSYNEGFYYYECDVNSRIHYFLSPLDTHVINKLFNLPESKLDENDKSGINLQQYDYNPAYNLPLSLKLFVENINSDENKVTPELVIKYPFLGNLPYGAEIGFLEIDWTKFDSSFIPIDESLYDKMTGNSSDSSLDKYPIQIPYHLKKKLYNRTTNIKNKRVNEERARVRGDLRREKETLEIFTRKEDYEEEEDENFVFINPDKWSKANPNHIHLIDDKPVLKGVSNNFNVLANLGNDNDLSNDSRESISAGGSAGNRSSSNPPPMTTKTSVWGTKVPVVIDLEEEALREEETRQIDELIKKVKAEAMESNSNGKGKKGKKGRRGKMVPLPL